MDWDDSNVNRPTRAASDVASGVGRTTRAAQLRHADAALQHAEWSVDDRPWAAALAARAALRASGANSKASARSHALLGYALAKLEFPVAALASFVRAAKLDTSNPAYAHNVGHVLDVLLERPKEALTWLAHACANAPHVSDFALSYAHALARAGEHPRALAILLPHTDGDRAARMRKWIASLRPNRARTRRVPNGLKLVKQLLVEGFSRLPVPEMACDRALALAVDARREGISFTVRAPETVAAALAYTVVWLEAVPLSASEVSASFRTKTSDVRALFQQLREALKLVQSDERYT